VRHCRPTGLLQHEDQRTGGPEVSTPQLQLGLVSATTAFSRLVSVTTRAQAQPEAQRGGLVIRQATHVAPDARSEGGLKRGMHCEARLATPTHPCFMTCLDEPTRAAVQLCPTRQRSRVNVVFFRLSVPFHVRVSTITNPIVFRVSAPTVR
jgi:hypothetical protein